MAPFYAVGGKGVAYCMMLKTMKSRNLRWILFVLAIFFLIASFFASNKLWTIGGFFICGGIWFWRARRKAQELDAPRPK